MRKLFITFAVVMLLSLPLAAQAALYVPITDADLLNPLWTSQPAYASGLVTGKTNVAGNPSVDFDISLSDTGLQYGWADAVVGRDATAEGVFDVADWATPGYTDFNLILTNTTSNQQMLGEIYINTGWVPTPGNTTVQSGWVSLLPGTPVSITLSLAGIPNLNQVTGYGFHIGDNLDPNDDGTGPLFITKTVNVSSVPIPSAIVLLASGLFGLVGVRRKSR